MVIPSLSARCFKDVVDRSYNHSTALELLTVRSPASCKGVHVHEIERLMLQPHLPLLPMRSS